MMGKASVLLCTPAVALPGCAHLREVDHISTALSVSWLATSQDPLSTGQVYTHYKPWVPYKCASICVPLVGWSLREDTQPKRDSVIALTDDVVHL